MNQPTAQTPTPSPVNQNNIPQQVVQSSVPPGNQKISQLQQEIDQLKKQKEAEEHEKIDEYVAPPISHQQAMAGGQPPVNPDGPNSNGITDLQAMMQAMASQSDGGVTAPQSTPQQQPTAPISTRDKERKNQHIGSPHPEHLPITEVGNIEFEAPEELDQWVEVKPSPKTIPLRKPIEDEFSQVILRAAQVPKPNITIPFQNNDQLEVALSQKVKNSIRWLGEWCKRLIKMHNGRVFYREPV